MYIKSIIPLGKHKVKLITEDAMSFCLYDKDIERLEIEQGEYYEALYEKLYPILKKRIYNKAMYLLSLKDYSSYGLRRKLSEDYPKELCDEVIDWAIDSRYIDDEDYLRAYIERHRAVKSKQMIKMKLSFDGFDKEIIDELIEELYIGEEENILKILDRKKYHLSEDPKQKKKIINHLLRMGYRYEDIKRAIAVNGV